MENIESNIKYLRDEPVKKAIVRLSVPMMIGMSVGSIYNIINAYFIGLVNDTAMLGAITLGLPIFAVLMALGNMFGVGGGTFITRLVAKNQGDRAKRIAGAIFYNSIILSLIVGIIAIFFIDQVVKLLGADIVTLNYTKQYATTLFIGGFAITVNFALEQVVRSEGSSKESMYGMFISILVSIVLDILFILVFNMHVYGVALSMIFANIASSTYYICYLNKKSENIKGFLKYFRINMSEHLEIYKIGVAELMQSAFLIITTLLLNNFSIKYGDNVVVGFGIALRIVQLPEFFTLGIVLGIMPLIAYNFSNKNIARLKEVIKFSSLFIISVSLIFIGITFIFRNQVIQSFSNDIEVLSIGSYILIAMLISALFNGLTTLFMTIYQASGEGLATGIMAISQGCLYIPVVIVLHKLYGLDGLVWSMTVTEVITFLVGLILYRFYRAKLSKSI